MTPLRQLIGLLSKALLGISLAWLISWKLPALIPVLMLTGIGYSVTKQDTEKQKRKPKRND